MSSGVVDGNVGLKGLKRLSLIPEALNGHPPASPRISENAPSPSPPHSKRMGPKRTSSICYISPSSPVVSSFLRSPPPSVIREANETSSVDHSRSLPLRRTASLPRHSITHHTSPGNSNLIVEAQTPPPMTLVEKHADLLSFIAQKESKCLELRGQLATHEAELATLKRKWERIVKRSTAVSRDVSVTTSPALLPEAALPHESKSAGLAPTAGEVVGVIRDGVQGLGRMLVMGGLGSSTMSPTSNSSSMAKSHVETVVGTTGSRSSSLSSIAVTSSTATDRSSVSSVTSLSPSDSEGEPPIPRKNVTEVGGLTPTSAQFPIDESASNNTKDILEPVVSEVTSTARPPSLLFNTLFADSKDPRTSSPARDLGERVTEKTLTSLSSASSPWSGINKKWEEIQKTGAFTKSSKRASLLLSDVTSASSNFLESISSALTPIPSSTHSTSSASLSTRSKNHPNTKHFQLVPMNAPDRSHPKVTGPPSILDEEDEEVQKLNAGPLENGRIASSPTDAAAPNYFHNHGILVPVQVPSHATSKIIPPSPLRDSDSGSGDDDDEAWNW